MPFDLPTSQSSEWAEQITALAHDLAGLHAPTEHAFLTVGGELRTAHARARDLAVLAHALAGRLEEPALRETLAGLDELAASVSSLRDQRDRRADSLRRIDDQNAVIAGALAQLERIVGHMRMVGMNAKIEAARMTGTGFDFTVFTDGVMALAMRGREALGAACRNLSRLGEGASRAMALQAEFERTHRSTLIAVADRLAGSVATVRARERGAAAVLARLPQELEHAHASIGVAVTGLQLSDNVRQRLEHVEEAVAILGAVLAGDPAAALPDRLMEVAVTVICQLQAMQLEGIAADLGPGVASVRSNVRQMAQALQRIRDDSLSVCEAGGGGASSFLCGIDRDLEAVADAVGHHAGAIAGIEASMRELMDAAHSVSTSMRVVRDILCDINVLGLNASIKCGNLGSRGRTLNVISQELRALAHQTAILSGDVDARVEQVLNVAVDLAMGEGGAKVTELEALQERLAVAADRLRQAGGESAWVLSHIQQQGAAVAALLEETAAGFVVDDTYLPVCHRAAERLTAVAAAADPHLPEGELMAARREVLGAIAGRYTMASERSLHAALLGEAVAGTARAEVDVDDILF